MSTKPTRSSSTFKPGGYGEGTGHGDERSAPYRKILGIGDSAVRTAPPPFSNKPWEPPRHGELKLNFYAYLPPAYREGFDHHGGLGGIQVIARNSSGDMVGFSDGTIKFDNKFALQLYSLKAAAILAKELNDKDYHKGPVVYESTDILATTCFHENCLGEPEENLKTFMPKDIDDVGKYCKTFVGHPHELMKAMESEFIGLKEKIETDKIRAEKQQDKGKNEKNNKGAK